MKKNKKKNIELRIESLNSNVTGSCNWCTLYLPNEKVEFLIDCGRYMEEDELELNKTFPFNPFKINFVVATHHHGDHTGRFPILYNQGYTGKIYASNYTSEFLKKVSISGYYEERRTAGENALWNESDAISLINNLSEVELYTKQKVHPNIEIEFFNNAHCRGAVLCMVICTWEDEKIYTLFTGDYKEQTSVRKSVIPEHYRKEAPITIVTEATYGIRNKPEACFDKLVRKGLEQGGNVLVLAYGESMFEEAITRIKLLKQKQLIDPELQIYIEINKVFEISSKILNAMPPNVTFVKKATDKILSKYDQKQKIVIVTERGGAVYFIPSMIQHHKNIILFTNSVPTNSNTSRILNTTKGERITYGNETAIKKAATYSTEEFGCHAFIDEIERLVDSFDEVNGILFGHGDSLAKNKVAERLGKKVKKSFVLKRGKAYKITPKTLKYY